ncbi:MAG TPA: Dabb family protein [Phycisphaerales bacterium]|nr:Dabb family protein [Phycisphaerales bacterium]
MVRNFLCVAAVAILLSGCTNAHKTERIAGEKPARVLRHVVLFKFKDGTTDQQIKAVENGMSALPGKIDAIYDYEWGTNVSPENLSEGFTHCFVITFLSEADRATYLPHPAHMEFGKTFGRYVDKVLVIDYWTKQ